MPSVTRETFIGTLGDALAACRRAVTFGRFTRLAWLAVAVFGVWMLSHPTVRFSQGSYLTIRHDVMSAPLEVELSNMSGELELSVSRTSAPLEVELSH
jgi:hypothetical protein